MSQTLTALDPVPSFDAMTLAGTSHSLEVMAGRWIVLYFVRDLSDLHVMRLLADIVTQLGRFFDDDHVVFYAVLTVPPPVLTPFVEASHRGLGFMTDYDGRISSLYGANNEAMLVVIDPLLRAAKIFQLNDAESTSENIIRYLSNLPSVDDSAGVDMTAPALIIPRVFESNFCHDLIELYEREGGRESGFMIDKGGKTKTVIDHAQKRRHDFVITDPQIRAEIRSRVTRRVLPAMERFFQYFPTRMDRYLVSCYGADGSGHFSRHRDNVNAAARHRRFAASFNLNWDYDGCELMFPEFGRRRYRAPTGGAIVFSTGALHQVTPIVRGKRYAFVPFFYGEEEAKSRLQSNQNLHEGEAHYDGESDRL